jgi:hypothetical protein
MEACSEMGVRALSQSENWSLPSGVFLLPFPILAVLEATGKLASLRHFSLENHKKESI